MADMREGNTGRIEMQARIGNRKNKKIYMSNKHFFNPHQNDQGWKGPCFFKRLIALKCLKCKKIKKNN